MAKKDPPDALASETSGGLDPTPIDVPAASVEALADTLINEEPVPQQHAIDQAAAERAQATETSKDDQGTAFDPALHTGTKTANGAWRKKSGRKPGGSSSSARPRLNLPGSGSGDSAPGGQSADSKVASSRATGKMAANLFLMTACGLGGAEWMPRTVPMDEKAMLEEGFADYFQSKQWEDMPPGIALVACIGMYALPRFAMPKTQERAKGFKNWIVGKYINWRARRAKKAFERKFGPAPTTDIERAEQAARRSYKDERAQFEQNRDDARKEAEARVSS